MTTMTLVPYGKTVRRKTDQYLMLGGPVRINSVRYHLGKQRNNSLRKRPKSEAHMKFTNYIESLTLYFADINF